jgi:3'-phosphoadenosine 5'-phosphosulfate sulfotransferase
MDLAAVRTQKVRDGNDHIRAAALIRVKLRFSAELSRGFSLRSAQQESVFVFHQPDHFFAFGNFQRLGQHHRQV